MQRRRIPQREVSGFISELEEAGATQVRRSGTDLDGLVEVSWTESEIERKQYEADLQAWRLPIALSALFALFVVVVLLALIL